MLPRPMGASSSPSNAWFSSSSWNARFNATIAANVNVTHRMLGAMSTAATAVRSRPKLNASKTRMTKAAADTMPVRARNSTSRSLRATRHACFAQSGTRGGASDRAAIGECNVARITAGPRRELHKAAVAHERDVGRELRSLFHVVRDEHRGAAGGRVLRQQPAECLAREPVEPRERLVEEQHARIVHQRPCDRHALHETARQRAHRPVRLLDQSQSFQKIRRRLHVIQRRPKPQILAHSELPIELRLMADPADGAPPSFDLHASTLRPNETDQDFEKRSLPGAVRAEDCECLTGLYGERNAVEGPNGGGTKSVMQSLSQQHRSLLRARSIRRVSRGNGCARDRGRSSAAPC